MLADAARLAGDHRRHRGAVQGRGQASAASSRRTSATRGPSVFDAVKEAIAIGERAGVPVDIIHLKIADQKYWGRMNEVVALIEEARKRGVNVQANVYPYTRGNNDLASIIPPWAHEGGTAAHAGTPQGRQAARADEEGHPRGPSGLVQPLHGGRRRLGPDARRPARAPTRA